MDTGFLGYDAARMRPLGRQLVQAVEQLDGIRSSEPFAQPAIAVVRDIGARLSTEWLPAVVAITGDTSLLAWASGGPPFDPVGSWHAPGRPFAVGSARPVADRPSVADVALAEIAEHFDDIDTDGDGELSWAEIVDGATSDDTDVAAACRYLVDSPLAFANTALAGADYSIGELDDLSIDNIEDGGWTVDMDPDSDAPMWQSMMLTQAAIAGALEQNRNQRTLARPTVFAAADGAGDGGTIDGRVSRRELQALMEQSDDAEVVAMCAYFLDHPDSFVRIDRESSDTGFDGTIAYDQVFELATNQGALCGLPDPTIPAALRELYGAPVDHGGGETQFLHYPIAPQPALGQVVVALYIPGRDRGPDPATHPSDSTLHVIVDYETGIVTVRIPPTVGGDGGISSALPITTDMGDGGIWFGRLTPAGDSNHIDISEREDGALEIRWAVLDADRRLVAPWLDGSFVIRPADGGQVQLAWVRDAFPALEAYHIYPAGEIVTLADDPAERGAILGLLDDFPPTAGGGIG